MSDAAVARQLEIEPRRYQQYVAGKREPDLATLARIASVLETTADELIGRPSHGAENRLSNRAEHTICDGLADHSAEDRQAVADLIELRRARRWRGWAYETAGGWIEALAGVHERLIPAILRSIRPKTLHTDVEFGGGLSVGDTPLERLLVVVAFSRGTNLEARRRDVITLVRTILGAAPVTVEPIPDRAEPLLVIKVPLRPQTDPW